MEIHSLRSSPTLYGDLAEKILSHIEKGILKPGDRVPSLRNSSSQYQVSLNTAKEAYFLLENQGYLESRPQSGYYVKRTAPPLTPIFVKDFEVGDPRKVSICKIYGQLMEGRERGRGESLAVALPDSQLLPKEALAKAMRQAYKDFPHQCMHYQMSPGWKPLREEISKRLVESGVSVSPDDVLITHGASEALYLAINTLCKPGDTVAVEGPTYFNFLHMLETLGLKVLEIPGDPLEGLSVDVLKYALESISVKAVIAIPNFSNPLGSRMPDEKKKALTEYLAHKQIPLIEDDTYGELSFDSRRPRTCKSYDTQGNVILCGSLSKTISPGLRIGWAVPGKFFKTMEQLKTLTNVATSSPNQIAAAIFLAQGGYERHLKKLRFQLARQSGLLREKVYLSFPPGTRISRPSGGLVLWVELDEGKDAEKLYQRGIKEGILIAPGTAFSTFQRYKHCLRLNAGVWNKAVETSVETLGKWAHEI